MDDRELFKIKLTVNNYRSFDAGVDTYSSNEE